VWGGGGPGPRGPPPPAGPPGGGLAGPPPPPPPPNPTFPTQIWQISEKYSNPFKVSVKTSTQKPLISLAAKGAEVAIDGVFNHNKEGFIITDGLAGAQISMRLGMGL
jgi:hypothetical protein